jgi:hypothetical protein
MWLIITPEPVEAYSLVKISTLTNDCRGAFLKLNEFDNVKHPQLVEPITRNKMPNSCLKNCGIYVTILS